MKRRPYNTIGRRILRVLRPENGGPRTRAVLEGMAGSDKRLRPVLDRLRNAGQIVVVGKTRHARYALGRKAA